MLWFACSQPERPPDAFVVWHFTDCGGCWVKAQVQLQRFPDDPAVQRILGRVQPTGSPWA